MLILRGSISIHEREVDLVVEWRIAEFFSLHENESILPYCLSPLYYYCPHFSFGGERWHLGIFRNGSSGREDLRLEKYPSGRSINLSFSLSLKMARGERYKEEHVTKDFDDDNLYHIFNQFISRPELSWRRSELVPDDILTVVCTMKKSTSAGSDRHSASAEICTPVSDSAGCYPDSGECRHCKEYFATGILSSHQRKCDQRPVKCPDCQEVVVLQKFLNDHECRHERPEVSMITFLLIHGPVVMFPGPAQAQLAMTLGQQRHTNGTFAAYHHIQ